MIGLNTKASRRTSRLAACAVAALALTAAFSDAHAQACPQKPIRFIVPSPPGGGTDTLSRLVASKLAETLQWQLVIDNRPGAGGNLGMDAAAKSTPDGYTIVMGESSNLTINPALFESLPFNPAKDLTPITLVGTVPLVLVVPSGQPIDSLASLIATAKQKPLAFASSGNGTVGHLVGEIWKRTAGLDLLHVPYKGAGPVMTDLLGGRVDLHFASLPAAASLIKSGKLRALAVTSAQRTESLPEVPTFVESGYRDFVYHVLYGVLVPARTPPTIVGRLNAEINRVLQAPDVRASLANNGVEVRGGTSEQFGSFLEAERTTWARAVKDSGAKVD
jgi:tripartite-type tricarboxylate transporter receptor subunit TctC